MIGRQNSVVVKTVTHFVNTDTDVFMDEGSTALVSTAIGVVVLWVKEATVLAAFEGTNFLDVKY